MFCSRLREMRMSRNYTQQKMADSLSLSLNAYQKYEQGTREPPLDMLVKLADTLSVSTDYLLCREGVKQMDKKQQAHDIAIALLLCAHNEDKEISKTTAFEAAKEYLMFYQQALNSLNEEGE